MSAERSDADSAKDKARGDEAPDDEKKFEPSLECPPAPRISTIELPPDEDDNMISGPSGPDDELPEALLFSDYGYAEPQK
ncbi:hypothetical protein AGABI1DRAFT_132351 [Agaricus bisporus var. burnettii JB137-S8]|uniref:Uncharacterized protein n=1 Tax=Agaricus bisporus var. burnettii (strain JB137-S8 / ATCC MYA-4627 / FGSC 10392) TaxID=597362 RepID=K5XLC7_AGABU|nr:uncharacterized protein AGABI1DRAFT_132351 [Agaricus bisporus var. burnettii JB137-S8]EKM75330.1 hypothetical protein AGABI1DRAFT_132351 [Agaricus bisporus var. burnettii JB137-S8]